MSAACLGSFYLLCAEKFLAHDLMFHRKLSNRITEVYRQGGTPLHYFLRVSVFNTSATDI